MIWMVQLDPENKTFSDSNPLLYCVALGKLSCVFFLGTEFARTCMRVLMGREQGVAGAEAMKLIFLGPYIVPSPKHHQETQTGNMEECSLSSNSSSNINQSWAHLS